jgi:hypothetical protein
VSYFTALAQRIGGAGHVEALDVVAAVALAPLTLTGDVTGTGLGTVATTLATVNAGVGSFGSATQVPAVTVNAKGLVTAASAVSIQLAEAQVTNLVTDLAGLVPVTRTVNGHALSANVTVTQGDVGLGLVENTALSTWAGSTALTTLAGHAVTNALLAQMPTLTLKGNNTGGTADALDLTAAQTRTLLGLGTADTPTFAGLTLTAALTVANGGTGLATLTAHALQVGAGTSALTPLGVGATGTVLTGVTGADPAFSDTPSLTALTLARSLTETGALGTVVCSAIPTTTLSANATGVTIAVTADARMDQAGFNHTGTAVGARGLSSIARVTGASGTVTGAGGVTATVLNTGAGTLTNAYGLRVFSATNSGGGALTNNYGVLVDASTAGTNVYGVRSNIAAATDRWNFYAGGTAQNYLAGRLGIGVTVPTVPLDVSGDVLATGVVTGSLFKTTTALVTTTDGSTTPLISSANMIGSTGGPTVAQQNGWVKMQDSIGATIFVPVWK